MSDTSESVPALPMEGGGATAVEERPEVAPPQARGLPPYRVLLHDDDVNDQLYVAATIMELTRLKRPDAYDRMLEAHREGVAQLVVTHREHAELLEDQFRSKRLTVSIEPV